MSDMDSLVGLIKQDIDEIAQSRSVFIKLPGYAGSGLCIKFRVAREGETTAIARKVETQERAKKSNDERIGILTAMDTIITLCDGFYVKPADVDEEVMLDPDDTGVPIRFDDRLCGLIGLPESTPARDILRKLFDNNEMAILNFADKLGRWLTDTRTDVSREVWQTLGG
jgi:hypothetical protein